MSADIGKIQPHLNLLFPPRFSRYAQLIWNLRLAARFGIWELAGWDRPVRSPLTFTPLSLSVIALGPTSIEEHKHGICIRAYTHFDRYRIAQCWCGKKHAPAPSAHRGRTGVIGVSWKRGVCFIGRVRKTCFRLVRSTGWESWRGGKRRERKVDYVGLSYLVAPNLHFHLISPGHDHESEKRQKAHPQCRNHNFIFALIVRLP